jgi:uncharacterized protein (TIGR02594 family)
MVTAEGDAGTGWVRCRNRGDVGYLAARYTEPDPTPWYTLAREEEAAGIVEIPGRAHHPRILEYHGTTTLRATTDETPWCSSFVNWCFYHSGIMGTRLANARSWLAWGRRLEGPVEGCVVVLKRGQSLTAGHVGFFAGPGPDARVLILGGNQSNRVSTARYRTADVLGYRMP